MIVQIIREKDFKVSINQMFKNDLLISEVSKRPMEVIDGVRLIEFKKNRSNKKFVMVYPEPRNIVKEIFNITHGRILKVVTEVEEVKKFLRINNFVL